ncbi:MAG TPA: hypothetical protein VEW69_12355 [Alphaproteobacteria bacterium]|nr:hypothetical protein [Alphaproteobacteria bacterium]
MRASCVVILLVLLAITRDVWATSQSKDTPAPQNPPSMHVADSGSFGIFLDGKRIGRETFRIEDGPDESLSTSEIKVDDGATKVEQSSEMRMSHQGALRSYHWRSSVPTKEEDVIEPKDGLLLEHVVFADQKKKDIPHILPISTVILDDYVFSQREILVWRYLASSCVVQKGQGRACSRGTFGILVPRQHVGVSAMVEMTGRSATKIKGADQELNELKIDMGGEVWLIWIDDQFKVQKMALPAQKVEIVRD